MATTTSIIILLKFFAGRQNSATIDFNEFAEYLKRYSEHHLEEQPSLVTYLSDTATVLLKELEKLVEARQILLQDSNPDKKTIIVIPFFIEKFAKRYKEILMTPQTPFPQEGDIPKKIPNEIVTRHSAAELYRYGNLHSPSGRDNPDHSSQFAYPVPSLCKSIANHS